MTVVAAVPVLSKMSTARRSGMTLVRLRDGIGPFGKPLRDGSLTNEQPSVHIIPDEHVVLEPVSGPGCSDATVEPFAACCGLVFELGSVEEVPWGTVWPHEGCLRRSERPRSVLERVFRQAEDAARRESADPEEMNAAITVMSKLLAARGRDWLQDGEGLWTFEPSFNGVFFGDRLYPRGRDIGLTPLRVEVPYPGCVHIHACGVRDGCDRHLARVETLPMTDMETIERRVSSHETVAMSILLEMLSWCLITGDCSAIPVYDAIDKRE